MAWGTDGETENFGPEYTLMGDVYGIITKTTTFVRVAWDEYLWKDFGKGLKALLATSPSQPLCPTNASDASSALKPVEVTLAGLVTVSNEMCLCSHSQCWDRPARWPADPPQVTLLGLRLSTR